MKAASIALIIAGLILPLSAYGLLETHPGNQGAQMDSNDRVAALNDSGADFKNSQNRNSATRWYPSIDPEKLKGAALVIHGLNCRPEKMESIIAAMTAAGIDCLNLSLWGHGENYPQLSDSDSQEARMRAFKTASYKQWRTEIYQAYLQVKKRGKGDGEKGPLCIFADEMPY